MESWCSVQGRFQLLRGNKTRLSGQIQCIQLAWLLYNSSVSPVLTGQCWHVELCLSGFLTQRTRQNIVLPGKPGYVLMRSFLVQCPHLSQRSLECKSALTLRQPLKYSWYLHFTSTQAAFGDDKMHTTTCNWLLTKRHPQRLTRASAMWWRSVQCAGRGYSTNSSHMAHVW